MEYKKEKKVSDVNTIFLKILCLLSIAKHKFYLTDVKIL